MDYRQDDIYYNIKLYNTTNTSVEAKYDETRLNTIVTGDISDYEVAVVRCRIPTNTIPIFRYKNQDDVKGTSEFVITIIAPSGNEYKDYVLWTNNTADPEIKYYVWTYGEWTASINDCISRINAAMILAGEAPTAPPFVSYDSLTQLFSFAATDQFNSIPAEVGKYQLWFNEPCFSRFEWFDTYIGNDITANKYHNLLFKTNGTNLYTAGVGALLNCKPAVNGVTYIVLVQQQKALFLLTDVDSVLLKCSKLPSVPELVSAGYSNEYNSDNKQNTSQDNFVPFLTDLYLIDDNNISNHSYLDYQPAFLRWTNVNNKFDLKDIDMQLLWRDVTGRLFKIYLTYLKTASIKLRFRKRNKIMC